MCHLLLLTLNVNINESFRTVLAAGEDTTSITMAFLLYELARHPEDQERVREEISVMYATKLQNGGSFKAKDYDDLPFLNAVIKVT